MRLPIQISKDTKLQLKIPLCTKNTCVVKPVLSGPASSEHPVLSGPALSEHPVLSGQFPKSRIKSLVNSINKSSIKRTPILSGHGHLN